MRIIVTILLLSSVFLASGCSESISAGNDKMRSSHYQDAPTYQQWQNIEALNCFMVILETLVNGSNSGSNTWFSDPYGWQGNQRYGQYGYYEPWMR